MQKNWDYTDIPFWQLKGLTLLGETSWLSYLILICNGECIRYLMGRGVESKSAWVFFILSRYYGILNVKLNIWVIRLYHPYSNLLSPLKFKLKFTCYPSPLPKKKIKKEEEWNCFASTSPRCWILYLVISYQIWVLSMMNIEWYVVAVSPISHQTLFMVHQ